MSKVILGGGITGLSAGHYLLKKYPTQPPLLLEASERVGGWIKSTQLPDGVIFEQGPRTIRPRGVAGANTLKLLEELKLSNRIHPIVSSHPAATKRMIFANDALHPLPTSIGSLFRKTSLFSKPLISYLFMENFRPAKRASKNDESIYDFVNRRLGKEISDNLISPMICGICGGNAKEISVKFLMESLFEKEQKYGSITKGLIRGVLSGGKKQQQGTCTDLERRAIGEKWSIYSFKGGLEILPNTLYEEFVGKGGVIRFNSECENVIFKDSEVKLMLNGGAVVETEHLISAVSADRLGKMVRDQHPELGSLLGNIKNVSLGVVNLRYKGKLLQQDGFGFLVAPKANLPILGVIYDSCCFPSGGDTVLTVMMGGYWFQKHFGDDPSEDRIAKVAVEQVKNIVKIYYDPVEVKVNILRNCIPQYTVGHQANLERINDYIKRNNLLLSLCGSSYYGVGVNDVILSAKQAVEAL